MDSWLVLTAKHLKTALNLHSLNTIKSKIYHIGAEILKWCTWKLVLNTVQVSKYYEASCFYSYQMHACSLLKYNQGLINGEEGMHRMYMAKFKNGAINSTFYTFRGHPVYKMLAR